MSSPDRTICLDLDGVLIEPYDEPFDPRAPLKPPLPGAAAFVRLLQDRGYTVVCLTARDPHSLMAIWRHLSSHGIRVSGVTNRKPPAVAYIDDRAIPFTGSFSQLMHSNAFLSLLPSLSPLSGPAPGGELAPPEDAPSSTRVPTCDASSPRSLVHGRTNEAEGTWRPPSAHDVPSASPDTHRAADQAPAMPPSTGEPDRVPGAGSSSGSPTAVPLSTPVERGVRSCGRGEVHPLPIGRGSVYDHTTGHLPTWWYRPDAVPDETDLIAPVVPGSADSSSAAAAPSAVVGGASAPTVQAAPAEARRG